MTKRKPVLKSIREAKYAESINCHYCGKKTAKRERHLDHKLSVESGGTNDPENLVVACKVCNTKKGIREYWAFIDKEIARVRLHLETLMSRLAEKDKK